MDSPRLGFRRAAVTSWALVGVGIAGVAAASALAYADTVKPAVADVGTDAAIPTHEELIPSQAENLPPAPDVVTTEGPPPTPISATTAPPPPEYTPQTTVEQPPLANYTPAPDYTPEPTVEQAPPATHKAPATQAQAAPTTKRRNLTPTTVMAPNYSPHVTISHGS
jgi:periplasmic protein TonB